MTIKTAALIVAAGRGSRAKTRESDAPKQYLHLLGETVLVRTILSFLNTPEVDVILPVIHVDDEAAFARTLARLDDIMDKKHKTKLLPAVFGGATRQLSVFAGLSKLAELGVRQVLVHDGARPLISPTLISLVTHALEENVAVIPALAIRDTVKRSLDGYIQETVPREGLFLAQTPQGFHFHALYEAHLAANSMEHAAFTDDASIVEHAGKLVHLIEGDEANLKLTTSQDFQKAEQILREQMSKEDSQSAPNGYPRIGNGFDVHAFEPGDHVTLCGVKIPFHQKLKGHSDADVGLHALTDAIYGALGAGDIGQHFPPSDPEWAGRDSAHFLAHAMKLVAESGGVVSNLDVTLICEEPKIGPHVPAMRGAIAKITGLTINRISVKATTSEKLGFTGRGEGIAAMASVLLVF